MNESILEHHRAIGHTISSDNLDGRAEAMLTQRERKPQAAPKRRPQMGCSWPGKSLTGGRGNPIIGTVAGTEAGDAEERPARDIRPERRAFALGAYCEYASNHSAVAAEA